VIFSFRRGNSGILNSPHDKQSWAYRLGSSRDISADPGPIFIRKVSSILLVSIPDNQSSQLHGLVVLCHKLHRTQLSKPTLK